MATTWETPCCSSSWSNRALASARALRTAGVHRGNGTGGAEVGRLGLDGGAAGGAAGGVLTAAAGGIGDLVGSMSLGGRERGRERGRDNVRGGLSSTIPGCPPPTCELVSDPMRDSKRLTHGHMRVSSLEKTGNAAPPPCFEKTGID